MGAYTNGIAGEVATIGGSITIPASKFGISSTNTDNAAGFSLLAYYILTSGEAFGPITQNVIITFPAGVYLSSGTVMDLTRRTVGTYTPRFTLKGSGQGVTVFRSTATSTAKCLMQILAGYTAFVIFEDFEIQTRTDAIQDGLQIVATRRPLDNTGGITGLTMRRVNITSDFGDACVFLGGDDYLGPNQFIILEACGFIAKRRTALKSYGQFGQINIVNGWYDGDKSLCACPSVALGQDLRLTATPTAVDTTNNFFTTGPEVPTGTAVRFVGANLPSGLSTGTTYYLRRYNIATDTMDKYTVHSSVANVVSDIRVALGTTGTLGNWRVAPLYVTTVTANNSFLFEFPHLLADGAIVTLVGSGLPTGLSTSTNYFVIRVSVDEIRLASSKANALAGIGLTFSGGTPTTFSLSTDGFNTGSAYSINMQAATLQDNMTALYLNGVSDATLNLHIENSRNALHFFNSQAVIVGGSYQNPSDDGGKGVILVLANVNSRLTVVGNPNIIGTFDNGRILNRNNGGYFSDSHGWGYTGASTSTSASTGMLTQYGAAATVDFGADDFVFVNASATAITTIQSKLPPKATLYIMAWTGTVTLGTGGNISLASNTNLVIPDRGVAILKRIDTVGVWAVVGKSF